MTRIIGGVAGGRPLAAPRGTTTRPTSDRVREALFSRLEHLEVLDGSAVLDLYAGSGALGLEAASRGASSVLLVESDRAAATLIGRNATSLQLPGVEVRQSTVERVLAGPARPHDLVLLDPPYAVDDATLAAALAALTSGWLAQEALVVVERSRRSPPPTWPAGLVPAGEKRYGDTVLWFAETGGAEAVADDVGS